MEAERLLRARGCACLQNEYAVLPLRFRSVVRPSVGVDCSSRMSRPLLLLLLPLLCEAAKILVFAPTISRSHMISNGRIADTLANAGHDVTLFEPDFLGIWDKVNNSVAAKKLPVFGFSNVLLESISGFSSSFSDTSHYTSAKAMLNYNIGFRKVCAELLDRTSVLDGLREEGFDALFTEMLHPCGHGLAKAIGIETVFWVSSCPLMDHMVWLLGLPPSLSYVPAVGNVDIGTAPSYLERWHNTLEFAINTYVYLYADGANLQHEFEKRFGPSFPSLYTLMADSAHVFVATDELADFPRPNSPHITHIGGLGTSNKLAKLEEPLLSEMSKGEKGVVLISLGTNIHTSHLPEKVMASLVNTAAAFPDYHFIVKLDKDDTAARAVAAGLPNVYAADWVPQTALLAHPRLRGFISHGGYNSLMETGRAGVPLIILPFFIDQFRNGRAIELHGWGRTLSRQTLLEGSGALERVLREILENDSIRSAAHRMSYMLTHRPFSPEEKLIRNVEYILEVSKLEGGRESIRASLPASRHLSFFLLSSLDLLLPVLALPLLVFWLLTRCCRFKTVHKSKVE